MALVPVTCVAELLLPCLCIALAVVGLRTLLVGDVSELCAVVWTTGLDAATESRQLHAAERLTIDDSSGDTSVDIQVTSHDGVLPQVALSLVERLYA